MFSLKITPILAADADARAEPGGFFLLKRSSHFPLSPSVTHTVFGVFSYKIKHYEAL